MTASPHIRPFRWQDLATFTRLFNRVHGIDGSYKANDLVFMRQFLSQPSIMPEEDCVVAESEDEPVGLLMISRELNIGRIVTSGGVLESHRNQGIGRRLVRLAKEKASDLGGTVLHTSTGETNAQARHLLKTEGFQPVRRYWQMAWEPREIPAVEVHRELTLRTFKSGQDEQGLTDLQNAAFDKSWGFCPNTVDEVSARVRFNRSDPEGIILVADGNRLAAYNWTFSWSNEWGACGWIAMTGVHPDYRGQRLGRTVLATGLDFLRRKGVDLVELEVDQTNVPARKLYTDLGFKKVHETVWYEWTPGNSDLVNERP